MKPTLSELLGIDLFEMHDAMDKLGWTYDKHPETESTNNIRCCDARVILRGFAGVDTGQCVHCPKTLQDMSGLVPLQPHLMGFIEPERYLNDGQVWLPVDGDANPAEHRRVAAMDVWTKKPML